MFVRNLPFRAADSEISDFFSQVGVVEEVRRQFDDEGICPSFQSRNFQHVQLLLCFDGVLLPFVTHVGSNWKGSGWCTCSPINWV